VDKGQVVHHGSSPLRNGMIAFAEAPGSGTPASLAIFAQQASVSARSGGHRAIGGTGGPGARGDFEAKQVLSGVRNQQ